MGFIIILKPLQAPVTTAVLKLGLHCQGCIEKIHKIVSKTKGEAIIGHVP